MLNTSPALACALDSVENGEVAEVERWLESSQVAVDDVAPDGSTMLTTAVIEGQCGVVRLLLARGADPNLARMLELHEIARARTQMNEDAGGLSIEAATKLACEAMSMSGVRTESSGSVGSRSGVSSEGATSDVEGGGGETKGDTAGMESSTSGGGVDEVGGSVDEEDDEEAEGASVCPTVTQAVLVSVMRATTTQCCVYIFSRFSPSRLASYFIEENNYEVLRSISWIM